MLINKLFIFLFSNKSFGLLLIGIKLYDHAGLLLIVKNKTVHIHTHSTLTGIHIYFKITQAVNREVGVLKSNWLKRDSNDFTKDKVYRQQNENVLQILLL